MDWDMPHAKKRALSPTLIGNHDEEEVASPRCFSPRTPSGEDALSPYLHSHSQEVELGAEEVFSLLQRLDIPLEHCLQAREKMHRERISLSVQTASDVHTQLREEQRKTSALERTLAGQRTRVQEMSTRTSRQEEELRKLQGEIKYFRARRDNKNSAHTSEHANTSTGTHANTYRYPTVDEAAAIVAKVKQWLTEAMKRERGNEPLCLASEAGDLEGVRALLLYSTLSNCVPSRSSLPFTMGGINVIDRFDRTPLQCAAFKGDLEIVSFLVERKANMAAIYSDKLTPLHIAAQEGHTEIVSFLISQKADIEAKMNGETPLYMATAKKRRETVSCLIEHGANIDAANSIQITPLHMAVMKEDSEIISLLIRNRANINAQFTMGGTALHIASRTALVGTIPLLISHGANLEATTMSCVTPLHEVAESKWEMVSFLITMKADMERKTSDHCTPLHIAARAGRKEIVSFLISQKANTAAMNKNGKTPLDVAVGDEIKSLLQSVNIKL